MEYHIIGECHIISDIMPGADKELISSEWKHDPPINTSLVKITIKKLTLDSRKIAA